MSKFLMLALIAIVVLTQIPPQAQSTKARILPLPV